MTNPKAKPETEQDLIDALVTLLESEEDGEQIDGVDDELRSAGYDPAALGAQMARVAEEAYTSSPHNWRRRAATERAEAEAEQLMHAVQNSMMEPKDLFGNKKDWESACNAIRSIAESFGWNADAFMPEWDEEEEDEEE